MKARSPLPGVTLGPLVGGNLRKFGVSAPSGLGIVRGPVLRGIPTPRIRPVVPKLAVSHCEGADGRLSGGHQPFGWSGVGPGQPGRSQVHVPIFRYHVVDDRRVAKNPRKTLNDRRKADGSTACSGASDVPLSLSEELIRLGCLRQAGLITEFEFDDEKSRVLDQYRHRAEGEEADPSDLWSVSHRSEQL
jgi:hypothetical protein